MGEKDFFHFNRSTENEKKKLWKTGLRWYTCILHRLFVPYHLSQTHSTTVPPKININRILILTTERILGLIWRTHTCDAMRWRSLLKIELLLESVAENDHFTPLIQSLMLFAWCCAKTGTSGFQSVAQHEKWTKKKAWNPSHYLKCTQNMNVFSKIHKRDIICSHFYANGHILTSNCISCCCGMYVYCGANLIKSNAIHIVPCVLNVNVKNLYFHIALSWNYFFFLPSIFFMPLPIPLTTLNMLWKDR